MQKRHLDKKRLSIAITTVSLILLFIALVTLPIIKSIENDLEKCLSNLPNTTEVELRTKSIAEISKSRSLRCRNDNRDLAYTIQTYTFWIGILLLLGYWIGLPLIKKSYNYLLPKEGEIE